MNLFRIFQDSAKTYPENTAIYLNGTSYSYQKSAREALKTATLIAQLNGSQVGLYGGKSFTMYAGLLGILAAGKTYVALSLNHSSARNSLILKQAEIKTLIVDDSGLKRLSDRLSDFPPGLRLIFPEHTLPEIPEKIKQNHAVYTQKDLKGQLEQAVEVPPRRPAYILFTSGSTGVPKGVPVSHANLYSFLDYLHPHYKLSAKDRFSQTYDLSFDPSFQNLFLAWGKGAALYVVPDSSLLAPAKFIKKHELTVWDSVPSMVQFMLKFRMLKPNSFPTLRYSFLGGESLPVEIAQAWQRAAPNCILENHYGPTETTIGISRYRIPSESEKILQDHGVVSIGQIFETQEFCLIDENGKENPHEGELYIAGSQVTQGYWNNPEKTKERFVSLHNDAKKWYRTGDLVRQKEGKLFFIGRGDMQVKIRGFRVELEEVNLRLREILTHHPVFSLAYPVNRGMAENLYSFVEGSEPPEGQQAVLAEMRKKIPEYMIPKKIIFVKKLPMNPNGKIDIPKLKELLIHQK